MSADAIRRRGHLADIGRRLALLSLLDLRAIDRALQAIERRRSNPGAHPVDSLASALQEVARDIEAEDRAQDEAHERERDGMFTRPACTGLTARWCPRCGDCKCGEYPAEMNSPDCPLHAPGSRHAEPDVHIGLPGDDLGAPIAVDSEAP